MRFDPKNATANPGFSILNPGVYPFIVLSAEDKTSTAGNEMISLKINAGGQVVFDNLVAHPKMVWRIKHFFESAGMAEDFERGEVSAKNCTGKKGILRVDIEQGNNGKDRNIVTDYLTEETADATPPRPSKPAAKLEPDNIPW